MSTCIPENLASLADTAGRKSNLAFAFLALPRAKRESMRLFYTFCRIVDDIADSTELPTETKRTQLAEWRDAFLSPSLESLPRDLSKLITDYALEPRYFLELIKGVESDLDTTRYETFEQLRLYCWRVASTVGLVSIRIFGCKHPNADRYAESLGMALQITNILRDVREDLLRDRLYLPLEDCARFHVHEEDLINQTPGQGFLSLMEFEATRADAYFQEAGQLLPTADQKQLPASRLMEKYYSRILQKMRKDHFQVFTHSYRLSLAEKLAIALPVLVGF
ncbi:MAG: squalene/phytoene synthase family protein [Chthoniobacterales bacterium]